MASRMPCLIHLRTDETSHRKIAATSVTVSKSDSPSGSGRLLLPSSHLAKDAAAMTVPCVISRAMPMYILLFSVILPHLLCWVHDAVQYTHRTSTAWRFSILPLSTPGRKLC